MGAAVIMDLAQRLSLKTPSGNSGGVLLCIISAPARTPYRSIDSQFLHKRVLVVAHDDAPSADEFASDGSHVWPHGQGMSA